MGLPVFIENSKIPSVLSKLSPIEIGAITLGPIIISKGKMDETLRRHETIHWEQYKECLIVGFLFLYLFFWLRNLLNGYDGKGAYYNIPFEREAYDNQHDSEYLLHRKRFAWASPRDIK